MAKGFTRRSAPGSGEEVGTYEFAERVLGSGSRTFMRYGTYRHPRRMQKIAHNVTAAGIFPSDGTGVAAAIGGSSITLPVGIPTTGVDYVGLIVTVPLLSQVRKITVFDSGTRVATLDRAWTSNPASNTPFMLLFECEGFYAVTGKVEYDSLDPAEFFDVCVGMGDVPTDSDARLPILNFDSPIACENLAFADRVTQLASHGRGFAVECDGGLGCKVEVLNVQAGTQGHIWLGSC